MGRLARLLSAWLCCGKGGLERGRNVGYEEEMQGYTEKPSSPPPVMEPVLSIACHGSVMGQERNVFVSIKNNLLNSSVRVTQLARPCDVLLVFHDISSGVSVEDLLVKVKTAAGESGALKTVLILMYPDLCQTELAGFGDSSRKRLGDKNWRKLESAVPLVVDMVYSERDSTLFDCLQNTLSLEQVVMYLKHVVRNQNAMLTGDSFTISRAIQQTALNKNAAQVPSPPESPVPSPLIPAGQIHQGTWTGSAGSSSQGSLYNAQSPQGSPPGIHHNTSDVANMKIYKLPQQVPGRKGFRDSRDYQMPPRFPVIRKARDPRTRCMTWGGWDRPKSSRASSKSRKGRSTPTETKSHVKKNEIRAIATGYPSNAVSGVKSTCYQNERFVVRNGQTWQTAYPPVFDGNCFLEMIPQ